MDPDVRQYLQTAPFERASVRHVQSILPDDAELDRWLEQLTAEYAAQEFVFLTIAALVDGRRVDARHLVRGAAMLDAGQILPEIGPKFTGDIAGSLLDAVQHGIMPHHGRAWALGIAAVLEREGGKAVPPEISRIAWSMAKLPDLPEDALPALHGVATYLNDKELIAFLRQRHYPNVSEKRWRQMCEGARTFPAEILKMRDAPAIETVPEKGETVLSKGENRTMRRSVARIGRNERCPCGSGKKYKHCCFEKDQERLRHSSEFAGVTQSERDASPEEYLTANRLKTMSITELLAIDPDRIPAEHLEHYFDHLIQCREFDRAADACEKLSYWSLDGEIWDTLVSTAAFYGHSDASRRLINLKQEAVRSIGITNHELEPMQQLIPLENDPVKTLEWIDNNALSALESGDVNDLHAIAHAAMMTKHRAFGILLARGVIPLLSSKDASSMLEHVLRVREQLNLDADEPIGDVVDKLWAAGEEASETDNELRQAREFLEVKRREASELKESLDRMQRQMKRLEETKPQASTTEAVQPAETETARDLRRKIQKVEQELRERNAERTNLRRELQQKQHESEVWRDRAESSAKEAETDSDSSAEEELLLLQESETHQPLRLIEFPRDFEERLNAVPRNVAQAALATLGRLAGGEPAAFVGAKRLKLCPSVTRQRIVKSYRLLFRLLPGRIQVLDLIPRNELERKVKILATQYD
jgi:hypothetical protein